jgi:23S rRNA (cytidine1920-2'-O)/16S rRNA (cytidine1409-2'-O)-methyltransferase
MRLDQLLLQHLSHLSRNQASSFIMQGKVKVDGKVVTKPGASVSADASVECIDQKPKYVSRAGFKMEKALEDFGIDVKDKVVLDAGISTGGFTDCLLQNGAKKIFGVDVGYGQVHEKVGNDPRVVVMERTNLRKLTELPEKVDLVTLDLSFISVLKVIESVKNLMKDDAELIVLIKPQFEAEKHQVGRGGIIKDPEVHQEVIEKVKAGLEQHGFNCKKIIDSPIEGTSGNKEFLGYFVRYYCV